MPYTVPIPDPGLYAGGPVCVVCVWIVHKGWLQKIHRAKGKYKNEKLLKSAEKRWRFVLTSANQVRGDISPYSKTGDVHT